LRSDYYIQLLPYAQLQRALDVPTIRELEDLIIDAIYQDLLQGKLDQRHQRLEVSSVVGRDLPPGELQGMLNALTEWSTRTAGVIAALDAKIKDIASTAEASKVAQEEHEKRRDTLLTELVQARQAKKGQSGMPLIAGAGAPGDLMDIDDDKIGGGFLGLDWGRKKNARPAAGGQNVPEKQGARKRNRF
jgi:COP9 signalosome complex subunit 7